MRTRDPIYLTLRIGRRPEEETMEDYEMLKRLKAAVAVLVVAAAAGWFEVWHLTVGKAAPATTMVKIAWQDKPAPDHLIIDGIDRGCKVYGLDSMGFARWKPAPCDDNKPVATPEPPKNASKPLTKAKTQTRIKP